MYNIVFYEKSNGKSDVWDFLEELRLKSKSNKDARIQYKQIILQIQLLQEHGTHLSENITKHVDEDIWELRPGFNRIFYFYHKNNTFVLLHHFRKKTNKAPSKELSKAKKERDEYLLREGKNENLGKL